VWEHLGPHDLLRIANARALTVNPPAGCPPAVYCSEIATVHGSDIAAKSYENEDVFPVRLPRLRPSRGGYDCVLALQSLSSALSRGTQLG